MSPRSHHKDLNKEIDTGEERVAAQAGAQASVEGIDTDDILELNDVLESEEAPDELDTEIAELLKNDDAEQPEVAKPEVLVVSETIKVKPAPEKNKGVDPATGFKIAPPGERTIRKVKQAGPGRPAREIVVLFKGPAGRYSRHGIIYEKNVATRVPEAEGVHLLATKFFERMPDDAVPPGSRTAKNTGKKQYRVGSFKSKPDALGYAREVHGLELDANLSLGELNKRTAELLKGSKHYVKVKDKIETIELDI